jgi:hypothetical protein
MDMYFYVETNKNTLIEVHYKGKAIIIGAVRLYAARETSQ